MSNKKRKLWEQIVKNIKEDQAISQLVFQHGSRNWALISTQLLSKYGIKGRWFLFRSSKQCRQRWHNHLDPSIKNLNWTQEQQKLLFELHQTHKNKWSQIAKAFPGRTDNSIKNQFYSTVRRNIRAYNRKKPVQQKLGGPIQGLLKRPQLKEILTVCGKRICKKPEVADIGQLGGICRRKSMRLNGWKEGVQVLETDLFPTIKERVDQLSICLTGQTEKEDLGFFPTDLEKVNEENYGFSRGDSFEGFDRKEFLKLLFTPKSQESFPPFSPCEY